MAGAADSSLFLFFFFFPYLQVNARSGKTLDAMAPENLFSLIFLCLICSKQYCRE
jgi:hypothetical protein